LPRFLASRQIARRPGALRAVVLSTVAVALAAFAVDSWDVSAENRQQRAAQEVGAAQVLHVTGGSAALLLDTVRAADPSGRRAMAAAELIPVGAQGRIVAVDAPRLPAVGEWRAGWADRPVEDISRQLHPPMPEPLVLGDGTLTVRATGRNLRAAIGTQLALAVERGGTPVEVPLGGLRSGSPATPGR
jgi:hypothetical protein